MAENVKLRRLVEFQAERIGELEKLIEEVRRGGKRQAAPFSKGITKPNPKRSGRKGGGDYGTKARRALPVREPDRVLPAPLPPACPHCACPELIKLRNAEQFVEDLPEPVTVLTRFDVAIGICADCGHRVQGRHPEQTSDALGAAASQIGPRALATAAWLHKVCGMPLAKICAHFARLGLSVTPGALAQAMDRMAAKSTLTYEALKAELAAQAVVSPDETGWRVGGLSAWLWAFAAATITVYAIGEGRSFDDATAVLPADFAGVLCRDGWAPYRKFTEAVHQSCLAHWLRRTHDLGRSNPPSARAIPAALSDILHDALTTRALRDAGVLDQSSLAEAIVELEARIDKLLAKRPTHAANRRLLKHLRNERPAMLTFVGDPAVDATNWRSEQAVRPAVANRKVCGGNRTWNAANTQQILMTLFRTAYQQGADAIALLADLLRSPTPIIAPLAMPHTGNPGP
ncbi:MAG: IS66 family transposase [Acidimicrobiales bacterium]